MTDAEIRKHIRARLLSARQCLDLTQRQMAALVGVTQSHLCKAEAGQIVPRANVYLRALDLAKKKRLNPSR